MISELVQLSWIIAGTRALDDFQNCVCPVFHRMRVQYITPLRNWQSHVFSHIYARYTIKTSRTFHLVYKYFVVFVKKSLLPWWSSQILISKLPSCYHNGQFKALPNSKNVFTISLIAVTQFISSAKILRVSLLCRTAFKKLWLFIWKTLTF